MLRQVRAKGRPKEREKGAKQQIIYVTTNIINIHNGQVKPPEAQELGIKEEGFMARPSFHKKQQPASFGMTGAEHFPVVGNPGFDPGGRRLPQN